MDWFDAYDYAKHENHNPFSKVNLETALVVGAKSDLLFPQNQQEEMVKLLNDSGCKAELDMTESVQGHDSFLVDEVNYSRIIRKYLNEL